jgi:hypothetical protein
MKMGDKRQETITKYLGDMKSVVSHVQTAMERQRDEFKDKPDVSQTMGRIAFGLQRHSESIGRRLEALGGSPTHPVKEVVSDAVGIVAGLYNKVRTEGAAKGLRDDHVALNLVCISYSTMHTTAVALGDPETGVSCETVARRKRQVRHRDRHASAPDGVPRAAGRRIWRLAR